jgi:hypothetical protein
MRSLIAACIAIAVLWAVDVEFNDARYSNLVRSAVKSAMQR